MKHDPLAEALRGLPRSQASENFSAQVLARLAEPADPAFAPRRGRAATLVAAALVAVAVIPLAWWQWQEARHENQVRATLAALRAEHRQLQDEWRSLQRLAADAEPVLYLAGDDRSEVVLDLRQIPGGGFARSGAIQPAAVTPAALTSEEGHIP